MYLKSQGLLYGLFQQTRFWLEKSVFIPITEARTRSQVSAAMWRDHLMEGMSFKQHGHNRCMFHEAVRDSAQEFCKKAASQKREDAPADEHWTSESEVVSAAEALCRFLGPDKKSNPTILLCFDEAHELTASTLSRFSELRRALQLIRHLPIWTIFLSTAGKFHLFTPELHMESSSRIASKSLHTYPVITETGFDEFAEPVASGSKTLSRIASTYHMAHLGRALFATRFDQGGKAVREGIIDFAQAKLLGLIPGNPTGAPPSDAQLACLAVRLGLDFKATSWGAGDAERRQVERHMRLALYAGSGSESMVTTSSSEPLLAEASYMTMRARTWMPVYALHQGLMSSGVSAGDRGEIAAALLLLLARDAAAARKGEDTSAPLDEDGAHRVISVTDFLQALLETDNEELVAQPPTSYHDSDAAFESLEAAFKDGKIWFNHFVHVDDYDVINQEFLWRLISRGAAVICATNELAIDLVVPVVIGDVLAKENVTAIFIQVKNDKRYTEKSTGWLFDAMDPFRIGLFSKGVNPLPVICMVFALASKNSVVGYLKARKVLRRSKRIQKLPVPSPLCPPGKKTTFTAYDIWCAAMTSRTFRVISYDQEPAYADILLRARSLANPYTPMPYPSQFEQNRGDMRRAMKPGVSSLPQHHQRYIDVQDKREVVLDDAVPERVQEDLQDRFSDAGEDSMDTDD
ncbi:hypothetical protein CPB85DRAFT_245436 [Mucidula mucida]|nr:hypothetical protein CPB85DRAFT_245436 [Mucidula mucida]